MLISLLRHHPLSAVSLDYADGEHVEPHLHHDAQFLYAVRGLMRVVTASGAWIIPPTRAVWIPAGLEHEIFMSGPVHMRSLFIAVDVAPRTGNCCVLSVTPLLRELILRAGLLEEQDNGQREAVQRLILDEVGRLEHMPLYIPMPRDRRLQAICLTLLEKPEHTHSLEDWAQQVGASSRTLTRLFRQELGMGFQEWRQLVRLTEALPRLLAGDSVQRIAQDLGYASGRAFAAMFRRLLGETPRAYVASLGAPSEP
jgi:AraC-like DNA-binding protein